MLNEVLKGNRAAQPVCADFACPARRRRHRLGAGLLPDPASMGKEAEVVLRDGVPRIYQPLPFADEVVQAEHVNRGYEAAIILECDSLQRTRLAGLESIF